MSEMYFAAKEAKDTASILLGKANGWYNQLNSNGYMYKLRDMWAAYHGAYFSNSSTGHQISFSGEQGELTNLAVNHIRNIARHMLTMITANRPAMEAKAINTDARSISQTKLANTLLEYYMKEKRLEKYLVTAVEYAIVLASGYVKLEWNETAGDIYDYNEETGAPIYEGDIEFSNLSPFDVVFDSTREDDNHDWIMCRTWKNKHDLIAKFPDKEESIRTLPSRSQSAHFRFVSSAYDETDDIAVYEFYHKQTEAMPDGRYLLFLDNNVDLIDSPMPYRELPVYRITSGDILGTPYGYTPLFDLLPLQDAVNSLYSTILTNQSSFGVQNIYVPRGADINFQALEGGLNLIEGNSQFGKPEPLNLTNTPAEIFNYLQMLEKAMETVSGVNSVTRGNPEASLKSGTALAMVHSTALQFISGLQASYIRLIEDVGSGLLLVLRDFAKVPRVALIVGKNNRSYLKKDFTGEDLESINRVTVSTTNPLSKTTAGRVQMASELIQYGIIKTPEEYFTVLNSGNLETMTEDGQDDLIYVREENERMAEGIAVTALSIDDHVMHIKKHKGVLNNSELRNDPNVVSLVLSHIQEHIELLRETDPGLLSVLGQQPLGPVGGTPNGPQAPQDMNQSAAPSAEGPPQPPTGDVSQVGTPPVPTPPPPFEGAPVNPQQMPVEG